jgi:hypothetical protein
LSTKAEKYRRHADECQQDAAHALSRRDKERYLKIAEFWLKMVKNETRATRAQRGSEACEKDLEEIQPCDERSVRRRSSSH